METTEIRQARPSDFPLIWNIFKRILAAGDTYPYASDTTEEEAKELWFGKKITPYLAICGEEVRGAYCIKPNFPGRGSTIANASFIVDPNFQGKGTGLFMGKHALDEAKKAGFQGMQFNFVVSTNKSAVSLWQRLGFSILGTVPQAFNHQQLGPVDVYIMYRKL